MRLGQRAGIVRHMQKGFLADHRIHRGIRQRHLHHVAFDHAYPVLQADPARELRCARNAGRSQFDARDVGAVAMCEIARRSAEPGAEIGDARARANVREPRERIGGAGAAVVVLVVRQQLIGLQIVEVAAALLQLGEDDLGRDRMAVVEIDRRMNLVAHAPSNLPGLRRQV